MDLSPRRFTINGSFNQTPAKQEGVHIGLRFNSRKSNILFRNVNMLSGTDREQKKYQNKITLQGLAKYKILTLDTVSKTENHNSPVPSQVQPFIHNVTDSRNEINPIATNDLSNCLSKHQGGNQQLHNRFFALRRQRLMLRQNLSVVPQLYSTRDNFSPSQNQEASLFGSKIHPKVKSNCVSRDCRSKMQNMIVFKRDENHLKLSSVEHLPHPESQFQTLLSVGKVHNHESSPKTITQVFNLTSLNKRKRLNTSLIDHYKGKPKVLDNFRPSEEMNLTLLCQGQSFDTKQFLSEVAMKRLKPMTARMVCPRQQKKTISSPMQSTPRSQNKMFIECNLTVTEDTNDNNNNYF